MCGRFFVATDDPELRAILKEIEQENKRQGMDFLPMKTVTVCSINYTVVNFLDKNKAPHFHHLRWGFPSHDRIFQSGNNS